MTLISYLIAKPPLELLKPFYYRLQLIPFGCARLPYLFYLQIVLFLRSSHLCVKMAGH
jgi:hypothetical protein